jgi:hypothetical protein
VGRAAALLALASCLLVYGWVAEDLPDVALWWEVAIVSLILLPATFALTWLLLPLRRAVRPTQLVALAAAFGTVTAALELSGLPVAANLVKFMAVTLAGFWFLQFFEAVTWVLLVAVLIVPVDIYSVASGPTKEIVERQPEVFDALSVAFPIPGEHTSAQLGLPDVLFFGLFLAACERFGLRRTLSWIAMTLSFGATLSITVQWDVGGLPALPLLSGAFVLANGDLLWRSVQSRPR